MIGRLLDEVFRRHFRGKYEVKITEGGQGRRRQDGPEASEDGEKSEVDPNFVKNSEKPRFLQKNILYALVSRNVRSRKLAYKESMQNTGRLIESNIPKLQGELRIGRVELYSFYILFKALSVATSQVLQPDGSFTTQGVLYDAWRRGIFQLHMMSDDMAKRVYLRIDESMEGILEWGEFLKGMQIINAKTKLQMIDLFISLADSNRTGLLDFGELKELSGLTLKRYFSSTNDAFFCGLTDFLARFIFDTCDTPLSEKLPIRRIKELIVEVVSGHQGHPNSSLILMFCGADI